MKIAGSVAIVTGASRGLGKAFSEELLKRGGKVCLADINEIEGRQTEQELKQKYGDDALKFVKCDVTAETDVKSMWKEAVEKFKKIDLMVNNAGIMNDNLVQKTIDVNLMGVIRGTMMALEHMRKDKGGAGGLIINVASSAGLFPVHFMPAYTASKYGVVGFTRSWAMNPSQHLLGVNFAVLCPSFTNTAMFNGAMEMDAGKSGIVMFRENKENIYKMIEQIGTDSVDDVALAFIDLVEKEDNNGAVLQTGKASGPVYRFTKHPFKL